MAIQRILGTDSGKVAFEKTDSNFQEVSQQIENLDANKLDKNGNSLLTLPAFGQPSTESSNLDPASIRMVGSNNRLSIGTGGVSNDRNGWIQSRHNTTESFPNATGTLSLNPLGGSVYINKTAISTGGSNPNGSITGNIGDIYIKINGGAATTLYVKESGTGNTGWVGK